MLILFLLALLIPIIASLNVKLTFSKYRKVRNSRGLTAAQVARNILDSNGLYHIRIEHISGDLTDHFDPTSNVVRLSDSVYNSTSVAAIGVAAHECGHACQHAEQYGPIVLRSKLVPVTNFCSTASYILVLLGLLVTSFTPLLNIGIFLFLGVIIFQAVTLPVEFNASGRALKTLNNDGILELSELGDAEKVLRAAALTYVAALISSIMNFARLVLASQRRR